MSEQDAPTVARATLWLDTSNETMTRRSECLGEHPVLGFERPEPEREPAATTFLRAASADTVLLELGGPRAALEASGTDELEPCAADEGEPSARLLGRPWPRIASYAAAFVLGGACALLVLSMKPTAVSAPGTARAQSPGAARAEQAIARPAVARPADTSKSAPEPARLSLALAVDALARGEYHAAHAQYAALARRHPNDAALARIAAQLAGRTAQRCAGEVSREAPCAR